MIAEATGIGDRGGLSAARVRVTKFSEEELSFPDMHEGCTVDRVAIIFNLISGITGTEGRKLSLEFGNESEITSEIEKKH